MNTSDPISLSTARRFTITETHESESHKRTSHSARAKWREDNPAKTRYDNVPTEFIAIDGEGITLSDGTHRYVLLGVGDQQITNPDGFEFTEICEFLWEQFLAHGTKSTAYVGFFLGYDFVQWLRSLSEERARMLLTAQGRAKRQPKSSKRRFPFPVRYGEWEFDILGMKRFRIRKIGTSRWMSICDSGPFFQKSFLKVIDPHEWSDPVVSQEEYQTIEAGKAKRASASLDSDMLYYNAKENAILPRVLCKLNEGFQALGIHLRPSQWYGPGQAAQEWLGIRIPNLREELWITGIPQTVKTTKPLRTEEIRKILTPVLAPARVLKGVVNAPEWDANAAATVSVVGVPNSTKTRKQTRIQLTTSGIKTVLETSIAWEAAREAYYGGWFEIMAHGIIPGITHEYDINSAYPYIISQLPCLEHGEWTHNDHDILANGSNLRGNNGNGYLPGAQEPRTLVYAKVTGSNPNIGAMLHRDDKGNISRPHKTEGWYWLHEINAAIAANVIDSADIQESWTYVPCDCPPPLQEVRNIYSLRKEVGKKTPLGIACKLVPNSLYGKFAQSIGSPKFANPVYASLITSGCRTMILNAIATHPKGAEDVVMVATDGIYFRTPHPSLPISDELGDWDHDEKEKLCLFKPGVYWDENTRNNIKNGEYPVFKARGINAKDFGKHLLHVEELFKMMQTVSYITGSDIQWPRIEFPVTFAMVTASQALQRNNWSLAGTLVKDPKVIQSADPSLKRQNPRLENGIWVSSPRENTPYEPSHPYEKRFGIEDPFNEENNYAITPDGYPGNLVWEALGRH